ncbi:MAG: hypothetical protein R2940_17425 [Syntrophotaleaceae bacterium]
MKQKIWCLNDSEHVDSTVSPVGQGAAENSESRSRHFSKPKNPAWAFSLSMIFWGAGHLYLRAYRSGSVFLAAMFFFYVPLVSLWFFRPSIGRLAADTGIQSVVLLVSFFGFLTLGVVCWFANAVDVYYRAARLRASKFRGVDNEYLPLVFSLAFPGWGQFLNGQPGKGLFFLLTAGAGVLSVVLLAVAPLAWPAVKSGSGSGLLEACLVTAVLVVVLSSLFWVIGVYDSFVSSKELYLEKLRRYPADNAMLRRRALKRLFPRLNAVLGLLLAVSLSYQLVPEGYYLQVLQKCRSNAISQEMKIIPALINRTIEFFRR